MTINWSIQVKKDTAANWTTHNPILKEGQLGWENNTNKLKIGDGSTSWNSLDYFGGGSEWGNIIGEITDQSDLIDYIAASILPIQDFSASIDSSATPVPQIQSYSNFYRVKALAVDAVFQSPSGTISGDGVKLRIAIKGNGTPRDLSFTGDYSFNCGVTAPTQTDITKTLYMDFVFNTFTGKLECIYKSY